MTIERGPRPQSFTILDNRTVRDRRLSWQERGLLHYVLSMPDHWRCDREHLEGQAPNGQTSVRTILAGLERHGYLTRRRVRGERGRWEWVHTIHERPVDVEERTVNGHVVTPREPAAGLADDDVPDPTPEPEPSRQATNGAVSPGQPTSGFPTGGESSDGVDQGEHRKSPGQPTSGFTTGGQSTDIATTKGVKTDSNMAPDGAHEDQAVEGSAKDQDRLPGLSPNGDGRPYTDRVLSWSAARGIAPPRDKHTNQADPYVWTLRLLGEEIGTGTTKAGREHWKAIAATVVGDFVERVCGEGLSQAARGHVNRLVALYGGQATLQAMVPAVATAGLDDEYRNDPRALTKYAGAVLSGRPRPNNR